MSVVREDRVRDRHVGAEGHQWARLGTRVALAPAGPVVCGDEVSEKGEPSVASGPTEGRYANYLQVGHNAFEFLIEFGQQDPGGGQPVLHTRIVATPVYASAFLRVLTEALEAYRQAFGEIPDSTSDHSLGDGR
jgi:hypothetical protein